MARILAIDYGGRRTGLACTDPDQIIVSPIGYVETVELFDYLKRYFDEEEVELVVVGYPLREDGSATDATPLVEKFVSRFRKDFVNKEIVLHDEYGTSREAVRQMIAGGVKKKKRQEKGQVDAMSAALILKSYLGY